MILVACVDDNLGMMFNHRRVSQDRELRSRLIKLTAGAVLRMDEYSAKQFEDTACGNITLSENPMSEAKPGEYCFVEDAPVSEYENKVEKIVLFKWNRRYPSDLKFDIALEERGWKLLSTEDFSGYSHEKITEEIYVR